ncbi:endoplasmic reticulum metallopeptidase 1 [Octopus bimaculoides]|uniref:Uncharacterized protein n=1 Tax=Octopus bimaculoides TaxID=37653 RepID=A0A0L8HGW2_OCTBM|nr:endoplasmic reticulum metallopeptidase 1 [Octopus bimaculoides]|eukprot:XP_014772391.1 PREDICTED: endoplasmic reticulum metallopeptidase 1-like [Octopus bimaculoides]
MDSVRQRRLADTDFLSTPSRPDTKTSNNDASSISSQKISKQNQLKNIPGSVLWTVVVVFHVSLFLFVIHRTATLPLPKKTSSSQNDVFEEETARKHLDAITGFGQRPVGSYANENLVKRYILNELQKIQQQSLTNLHTIQIDEQNVSGQFSLHLKSNFLTVYRNIKNIVAKLDPVSEFKDASKHSVLVNCHYDSVVGSPGAGDDASSCAVMLEVLRSMSQRSTPLRHSVIFLFNSAEENMLQASHGFITQHRWAKTIRAFVNLDAAGAGGWEIVFQAGPQHPWLIQAYAKSVKYPFASILGQEIFQGGFVPSDTDYQIFQKFGNIPGLDIAYVTNGYVYHTKNDRTEFIQPGCIQRGGENLKDLLETIASTPKLADPGADRHGNMVFYDVLGFYMFAYPKRIAAILNIVIVVCSLLLIAKRNLHYGNSSKGKSSWKSLLKLFVAVLGLFVMWISIVATMLASAFVLDKSEHAMSWYNHSTNIIWVFVIPALMVALFVLLCTKHFLYKNESLFTLEQLYYDANVVIWSSLLALLTYYNVGSAYLLSAWLLFSLLFRLFRPYIKGHILRLLAGHFVALCLPTLLTLYMSHLSLLFFLPIMGRVGSFIVPDAAVGVMIALPIIVISGFSANIWIVSSGLKKLVGILSVITLIGFAVVLFTDYGFPYSLDDKKPAYQRLIMKHIRRRFHDAQGNVSHTDSGIWFISLDHNGLKGVREAQPEAFKSSVKMKCEGPYCGWPYYYPMLWIIDLRKSAYILLDTELRSPSVEVKLENRKKLSAKEVELTFSVIGPDHMTIFVMPHQETSLVSWSLSEKSPPLAKVPEYADQRVYFIYYSHAEKPAEAWSFSMIFTVPEDWQDDATVTDIAFAGHYMHGGLKETPEMSALEKKLPKWVTSVSWTATYDSWKF